MHRRGRSTADLILHLGFLAARHYRTVPREQLLPQRIHDHRYFHVSFTGAVFTNGIL